MWDIIEDYFLGKIPEKVKRDRKKEKPDMTFD
jgi:ATP-dependent DNA helicase RecQ